jgi:hypothetical protein
MTIEIEYIETESFSETIPKFLLDDDLIDKIGKTARLEWLLVEPVKSYLDNQDGVFYQEIIINNVVAFSMKLNSSFFINLANEFKFNEKLEKKYMLIFKLIPTVPLKQKSRINWWVANIVIAEFENRNWKISDKKVWVYNEIYDNVLRRGEVKIKTA